MCLISANVSGTCCEPRLERLHIIDFNDVRRKIVPNSYKTKQTARELYQLVTNASIHESQAMPTRCSTRVLQRWLEIAHWEHLLEKLVSGAMRDFPQCAEHADVAS